MTNRKSTKRALLGSVVAMVLCLAMLVGATFAWFTDTASTGVNKIQAGNLDIEIQDENGKPVTNLSWVKAEGAEGEQVLWEPGCTYELTPFQIVNKGNLALKYKVTITGIEANIHYQYNEYLKLFAEGTALRPEIRSGANQGNHLHNVPTRKASLGFTFSHPDWFTLQASATWLGRIWQDQTDNGDIAEGNFWLGEFKLSKRFDYERYWLEPFIEMQGITSKDEIRYTNGSRVPINMFFVGLEAGF